MNWTGEHRAFNVETSIKTNKSAAAAQRPFRLNFNLAGRDRVSAQNTIMLRLTNFRATGSALKRKTKTGRAHTAETPEDEADSH